MSKSLGNFFTVRDLLDQGIPGEVIRFVFLSTHYRKPMDWTEKKAKEAEATLRKWWRLTAPLDEMEIKPSPQFIDALTDDLNTPGAIAELHRLAKEKDYAALEAGLEMLGLQETVNFGVASFGFSTSVEVLEAANDLARRWMAYRDAKNFEEADRLKKSALLAGVDLSVSKEGGIQVPSATINGSPTVDELEALK